MSTTTAASAEVLLAQLLFESTGVSERAATFASLAQKLRQSEPNDAGFTLARLAGGLLAGADSHGSPRDVAADDLRVALQSFMLMTVNKSNVESREQHNAVSEICLQHRPILEFLMVEVRACLSAAVSEYRLSDDLVVDSVGFSGLDQSGRGISRERNMDVGQLDILRSLLLLRTLFWHSSQHVRDLSWPLVSDLFLLVGAGNEDVSKASTDALLSFLSVVGEGTTTDSGFSSEDASFTATTNAEDIWAWINAALSQNVQKYRSRAFSIWLRLLIHRRTAFPSSDLLRSSIYWKRLVESLTSGTTEQRRFSLSILELSLPLCQQDFDCAYMSFRVGAKKLILENYGKFSTIYQTIVLGRYLNQVEACIPDLDSFAKSDSGLHKAWLTALLGAGIGSSLQDSIRKVTGDWIMEHGIAALGEYDDIIEDFFRTSFLPWASLGPLYNSSVTTTTNGRISCAHGDSVSRFLKEMMSAASTTTQKNSLVKTCFQYLADKGDRAFSFARAYILDGLFQGTVAGIRILDDEILVLISRVVSSRGVQGVVRDYIILLCANMVFASDVNGLNHPELRVLFQFYHRLTDTASNDEGVDDFVSSQATDMESSLSTLTLGKSFTGDITLQTFNSWLIDSQYCCLQGEGLQAACDYLVHAFDVSTTDEMSSIDWATIFAALWEETEAQDHPRKVIMGLPKIVLHPNCVRLCQKGSPITVTIKNIIQDLQALYAFRMYAFPPLVHAFRRVVLSVPEAENLQIADFFIEFARTPPSLKVEFELEAAMAYRLESELPSRSYEYYYGKRENYGHACIYDTLNRLPMPQYANTARQIVETLLDAWVEQKVPPPAFSYWKTTAQLQTIIILMSRIRTLLPDEELDRILEKLFQILAVEPMPRMRYLMEWAIIRILQFYTKRREEILQVLEAQDGSHPKLSASTMKMALMLARLPDTTEAFVTELMRQLIPLSASPKIVIRHEAHWTFPALIQVTKIRGWTDLYDNPAFARLDAHIRSLDTYKRPPHGRIRDTFDIRHDHNLTTLFQGEYLRLEPSEAEKLSREDLLALYDEDQSDRTALAPADATSLPLGTPKPDGSAAPAAAPTAPKKPTHATSLPAAPLQTKGTAVQSDLVQRTAGPSQSLSAPTVVVVASLIDNAHNLGGLSRCCEILGASALHVRDAAVLANKDFLAVAVASEAHLPIAPLAVPDVPAFLTRCKRDGFTVVGVEQTDGSRVLGRGAWRFPSRVVLVLGSERWGIEPALLAEMDWCVEVGQVGKTRSLNVQTAAAVVLYEYNRQHRS